MIIIEGVDNSGKTTLMKKLINDVPELQQYTDLIPKPWKVKEDYMAELGKLINTPVEDMVNKVFDRLLISEWVYGSVLGGISRPACAFENLYDFEGILDTLYRVHKPLLIYCRPPLHTIKDSFDERPQMEGVKDKLYQIISAYDRAVSMYRGPLMLYNYTLMGEDSYYCKHRVIEYLEQYREELNI